MESLELQPPGCSVGSVTRTLPTTDFPGWLEHPSVWLEGGYREGRGRMLSHIYLPAWKGHTKESKALLQPGGAHEGVCEERLSPAGTL